jgi:hypothetical protein
MSLPSNKDPRYNSHEAFAEWFNENVEALEDIEARGDDFEEVMQQWCDKNNHEYREDGVYNMNTKVYQKVMDKVLEEKNEYEAVEQYIMKCFRAGDYDNALRAHYREGKVIDGKWVNDEEGEEED